MARTFHFVGNEDFHFTSFGETSVDTTVGHYRANFTRCGLRAADGNSGWATPDLGGLTDFWFHARVWMQEKYPNNAFTLPGTVLSPIQFVDAAGIIRLTVVFPVLSRITNTNAIDWRFAKFDAAGTMTFLGPPFSATFTGSPTTPDAVDIQYGHRFLQEFSAWRESLNSVEMGDVQPFQSSEF